MVYLYTLRAYIGLIRFAIHAIFRGDQVIKNNCINNLHNLLIFDLITFNGLRPVISITNEGFNMDISKDMIQSVYDNVEPNAISFFGEQSIKDWIEDILLNFKKPFSMDNLQDYLDELYFICGEASMV